MHVYINTAASWSKVTLRINHKFSKFNPSIDPIQPSLSLSLPIHIIRETINNGPHEADGSQVHWRKGSAQAAGDKGSSQVSACEWRSEEAASLQAWYCGAA